MAYEQYFILVFLIQPPLHGLFETCSRNRNFLQICTNCGSSSKCENPAQASILSLQLCYQTCAINLNCRMAVHETRTNSCRIYEKCTDVSQSTLYTAIRRTCSSDCLAPTTTKLTHRRGPADRHFKSQHERAIKNEMECLSWCLDTAECLGSMFHVDTCYLYDTAFSTRVRDFTYIQLVCSASAPVNLELPTTSTSTKPATILLSTSTPSVSQSMIFDNISKSESVTSSMNTGKLHVSTVTVPTVQEMSRMTETVKETTMLEKNTVISTTFSAEGSEHSNYITSHKFSSNNETLEPTLISMTATRSTTIQTTVRGDTLSETAAVPASPLFSTISSASDASALLSESTNINPISSLSRQTTKKLSTAHMSVSSLKVSGSIRLTPNPITTPVTRCSSEKTSFAKIILYFWLVLPWLF